MNSNNLKLKLIISLGASLCVAAPIVCGLMSKDILLCIITGLLALAMFSLLILLTLMQRNDTERLLAELSDMIVSIYDNSGKAVFSEVNDSLLSKLQSQVTRLAETLTARRETEETEKNEIKSLISDISHQLKTPVASLRTYADLLLDETSTEDERREYLDAFSVSLDKLTFLTDSLIRMSRLESGIITLSQSPTIFNKTILDAIMQVFPTASHKNIEICFDNEKCELSLIHDSRWTTEAIFNILDNAVKYSPDGEKINMDLKKYELFARLDIADNGIGIPHDEQAKIFGRFFRGIGAAEYDGAGIGLYLSRKIISDQGGYIKVSSDGKGTVFSIFLPL